MYAKRLKSAHQFGAISGTWAGGEYWNTYSQNLIYCPCKAPLAPNTNCGKFHYYRRETDGVTTLGQTD
jgi:hypothetical protein